MRCLYSGPAECILLWHSYDKLRPLLITEGENKVWEKWNMGIALKNKIHREHVEKIRCTVYETCMGIITAVSKLRKNDKPLKSLIMCKQPWAANASSSCISCELYRQQTWCQALGLQANIFKCYMHRARLLTISISNLIHFATYN